MAISGVMHQRSSSLSYNTSNNNAPANNEKSKRNGNATQKGMSTAWRGGAKRNIRLENLMKQKDQLTERKQELMENGLENGEDSSSIQQKMKEIDKQIAEVDKQINKIQTEEKRKAMGTDDKSKEAKKAAQVKNAKASKQGAYEIASTENLDKLMSASRSLSKVKELSKIKKAELGEKRILDAEIRTDIGRGINPVKKENRVADIEGNVDKIDENIADSYKEVHKATTENVKEGSSAKGDSKVSQGENAKDSDGISTSDNHSVDKQQIQENFKAYTDKDEKKSGTKVDAMA